MVDNNTKSIKCPICGIDNLPTNYYCCQCGWEFKVLLTNDSIYASNEKKRENKLREYINKLKENGSSDDLLKKNILKLTKELEQANRKVGDLETTINDLKLSSAEKDAEISDLKKKAIGMVTSRPIVAIMSLTSRLSKVTKYLPIYEGVNTFGTDESAGKHQKINIRLRDRSIKPQHFSVECSEDRLAIFPIDRSKVLCDGVEVTTKGKYVQPQNVILVGEELVISMSLF